MLELLAKSAPKETIRQHTDQVLYDLECLFNMYPDHFTDTQKEMIRTACEYHDYGKVMYGFQKVLGNTGIDKTLPPDEIKKIQKFYKDNDLKYYPHGYISPLFLKFKDLKAKFGPEDAILIANAIYYHHAKKEWDTSIVGEIVNNDLKKRFCDQKFSFAYQKYIFKKESGKDDSLWVRYAVIIGILNKCDYHASSHSNIPVEISPLKDGKTIGQIVETKLPALRNVQAFMKENKDQNLVVTASTGLGKTEAALLWADNYKTFYTLPLKVSINAIYQRIMSHDGYDYGTDKVSLLHSDALSFLLQNQGDNENALIKFDATRALSFPLTICTVDQLFTFVYKYRGSELLLATLKYSKLIIDEIQAYSPELIAKIICGLKLITMCGGKFAIITATMPPVFEALMEREKIPYIKPEKPFLSLQRARHFISFTEDDFDTEKIFEDSKHKKVLVICNTIKKAQELYDKLPSAKLLHSHFIKKHRKMLEDKILKFTAPDNHENGIWISTQIVEASLDIDFDVLYTEMSTADSLLQRLGRCYRKREYEGNEPNVYIYKTDNGVKYIYNKDIYERSVRYLHKYNDKIFKEEDKIKYINKVYDADELKETDYYMRLSHELQSCTNICPGIYKKEDAKKEFRDITSYTVIPSGIYDKQTDKIEEAMELVKNSHDAKEKIRAKEYINSLTLSVPHINREDYYFNGEIKDLNIYTTDLSYDFDEEDCTGAGLLKDKDVMANMI